MHGQGVLAGRGSGIPTPTPAPLPPPPSATPPTLALPLHYPYLYPTPTKCHLSHPGRDAMEVVARLTRIEVVARLIVTRLYILCKLVLVVAHFLELVYQGILFSVRFFEGLVRAQLEAWPS